MGYIKKLKNNELVGGTDKTTIYPVTSTKAVFEEVTEGNESSFKTQETINKEQQDELDNHEERIQAAEAEDIKSITINGSTKKFEVDGENNVDLTIYTVDSDPKMPSIADNVEDLRNMVGTSTPVLETSHKTRIENLETTVGTGGTIDSRIATTRAELQEQIDTKQIQLHVGSGLTLDNNGNLSATLDPAMSKVVTAWPSQANAVKGLIYLKPTSTAGVYEQRVYNDSSYTTLDNVTLNISTDDALNTGSANPLKNSTIAAQIGYFDHTGSNDNDGSSKVKNITATGFTLPATAGGAIKIKMKEPNTYAGTQADPVQLQFNNVTNTKKTLYYNGELVSASNTWEAGETIAVYYNPSANSNAGAYFASNAQGGGNAGKKKLSGTRGYYPIVTSGGVDSVGEWSDSNGVTSIKKAVEPGDVAEITGVGGSTALLWIIAKSNGEVISKADNGEHATEKVLVMPDDAAWLYIQNATAQFANPEWYFAKAGSVGADALLGRFAEHVKYDNSTSGLNAQNVQGALDEVTDAIFDFEYVAATLPAYGVGWIDDNGTWADRVARYYLVPVNEGEVYRLTANANGAVQYAFLTNNSTSGAASFVAGTGRGQCPPSSSIDLPVPATAAYLYVLYNVGGTVRMTSLKIRTTVNALDKRINELDDAINEVQTSEERTESYNLEGYTSLNNKLTYRMRYNCGTHGRATVSFTAPSNFVLKIFCLSSFSAVSDVIDSSNTIVSAQNITPGVTKTITWDDSRAKYIVLSMVNTSGTALSESAVNTFKSSVNLVIEDLFGYDGLNKRVTDLETNVNQLSSLPSDVETLETDVSELKDLSYENVTIPASIRKANYWINDSQVWESLNNGRAFTLIEASEGDEFYIEGNASEATYMYWLSKYVSPSNGGTPYIVDGTSKFWVNANASRNFTAPAGTKYLYLLYQITDERSGRPAKLTVRRGGNAPKQESSELYYNGEKISVGNRLQVTLLQQLTDTKSGSAGNEVEGFAVINGYAAVTRLGGYITLYRLNNEKFYYLFCTKVSAFDSNNAANWGIEKYDNNDVLPLLYVSYQGGKTAYVFRVQTNGTCTLVQTITISNLPSVYCGEWAIDKERGKLIFYTTSIGNPASGDDATTHGAKHRVVVWPIPALRDDNEEVISNLILNYNEAEEAYVMEDQPNNNTGYDSNVGYVDSEGYYTWVYQGIAAKNGKLIIPCGGYSAKRRRGLRVWDMDAKRQINYVDLTNPVYKNHPYWEIEDCDVVDGCVYLFCRGVGGEELTFANVYKLDFD